MGLCGLQILMVAVVCLGCLCEPRTLGKLDEVDVDYYDDVYLLEKINRTLASRPSPGDTAEIRDTNINFFGAFVGSECPDMSAMKESDFEARIDWAIQDYKDLIRQFYPRRSRSWVHQLVLGQCTGLYHGFLTYNATLLPTSVNGEVRWNRTDVDDLVVIHHPEVNISCQNADVSDCSDVDTNGTTTVRPGRHVREYGDKVLVFERHATRHGETRIMLASSGLVRHSQCVCRRHVDFGSWIGATRVMPSTPRDSAASSTPGYIMMLLVLTTIIYTHHRC